MEKTPARATSEDEGIGIVTPGAVNDGIGARRRAKSGSETTTTNAANENDEDDDDDSVTMVARANARARERARMEALRDWTVMREDEGRS